MIDISRLITQFIWHNNMLEHLDGDSGQFIGLLLQELSKKTNSKQSIILEHDEMIQTLKNDISEFKTHTGHYGINLLQDYSSKTEFTLFVRMKLKNNFYNSFYTELKDKELQFNISGPCRAIALLRYAHIINELGYKFSELSSDICPFEFKITNAKDITNNDLCNLLLYSTLGTVYAQEMLHNYFKFLWNPDNEEHLLKLNDKYTYDKLVYNFAKYSPGWLLLREVSKPNHN